MPAAGHLLWLGRGPLALHRPQAPFQEAARAVPAGRDRPRALHPLLPLRALLAGGGRGLPARVPGPRRPHLRRHARRPPLRGPVQRQHHRAVPGGRAHLDRLPLPRAPVGHRGLGHGLHDVPVAVQRRADGARRRQGRARARARQRGRGRRLALRQGPLRLPGVRRGGAHHDAAGARRRLPARGLMGARAVGGRRGAGALRRAHGGDGRRVRHQRGGLPRPAPAAQGARLTARRVGSRRLVVRRARPCPRAPRPLGQGLRHRPRRRDPRARHRAGRGGADPRPARSQGGASQRRPAGGGLVASLHARPQRGRRPALRAGRRRGGRWVPWRRRWAARARDRSTSWRAGRGRPRASAPAHARRAPPARTPCAPRPTSCATPATWS